MDVAVALLEQARTPGVAGFERSASYQATPNEPAGSTMRREDIFHRDAGILGGTPVFTGTRVPVDTLTVHLKHGKRLDDFLDDFPSVDRAQAEAFLDLAEKELLKKADAGAA